MPACPLPRRLLFTLAAVALVTPACSSSGEDPPAAGPASTTVAPDPGTGDASPTASSAPVQAAGITIEGFDYRVPGAVEPGADVQVTNNDSEAHTVTLESAGPSVVVQGGSTTTFTAPADPGTYSIVCDFHGGMTAELVVA
jgi:plastocyanin